MNFNTTNSTRENFNTLNFYHKDIDWEKINKKISENDWEIIFENKNIDEILDKFYDICLNIALEHVPNRNNPNKKLNKPQRYRQNLTRRRRRIHKLMTRITSPSRKSKLQNELIDIEIKLQESYKKANEYNEQKAIKAIKTNSKYFYSYAKKFSKVKTKIGPLLKEDSKLTSNSEEMAEILSNQYVKVFSTPCTLQTNSCDTPEAEIVTSNIPVTEIDIVTAINKLSSTSAPGADNFPAIYLKQCKSTLAKPLTMLWKKSLSEGVIPQKLKESIITPIYKGGSKSLPANYRPVALTSHLIKIFEKIIRNHLTAYLSDNNLFNMNQHGFRTGRSCLSQLLDHFDDVLTKLQSGDNVDVIYLDFAKAFDKVDFNLVIQKMKSLGIRGNIIKWIKEFLTNREQKVIVNGAKSNPKAVLSGVPQGSALGPLIFLIMIRDIDSNIRHANVRSFADDTRALNKIHVLQCCSRVVL